MTFKVESTVKYLARKFGGKWRYEGHGAWECDDGNRYVWRVHTGGYDYSGNDMPGSSLCLYYRDGLKTPEWC